MFRPHHMFCIPLLMAATLHAGEITIEERPFMVEAVFEAAVMPEGDVLLLEVDAKTAEDFRIVELARHGEIVRKDGLLARFDTTGIDRKLDDTRRALAESALAVAAAEQELKQLVETAPHRISAARRAAEIAHEEHSYFTATRRKAAEESATQRLERRKQQLSNEQEELRQLTLMYQADDLTEDTEEIILTRQKDAVAAAEFSLRMETLDHQRTLEVTLPREAVTLADHERDTAISLRAAEQDIPRMIELKKLELETLKTTLQRNTKTLVDLEHDRGLFEFKAPADGSFYYGPIQNGRWTTGDMVKSLIRNSQPPIGRPFATFIPATTKLVFSAYVPEPTAAMLKDGLRGSATFAGREDLEIPVQVTALASAPEPDSTYRATLSATWPQDSQFAVASKARVRLVSYQKPAAISIPTKALAYGPAGWTVEIMLADGKTERRPVKRGRVSGDDTEILSGLEIGQVIIAP